jgi:hypothetical protein
MTENPFDQYEVQKNIESLLQFIRFYDIDRSCEMKLARIDNDSHVSTKEGETCYLQYTLNLREKKNE